MGTFVTLTLEDQEHLIEDGFVLFKEVDFALSSYKKEADIYKLNHTGYVKLHPYTYEALKLCERYYHETQGYFDITVGSITKGLYRFGEHNEFIPHPKLLKELKIGFNKIEFDKESASIKEGVKVDLGGMGKGFGVQKVAEYFLKNGVQKAVIAASGDIRCIGSCEIALQDPFSEDTLFTLRTKKAQSGITTSGNYRRYVASKNNNHLINPYLKQNEKTFASITLISELSSADLDAYATAASVMPYERAIKFLNSLALGYILVTVERDIVMSKNLANYVDVIQK